jgi:regulator of CtrA degradation
MPAAVWHKARMDYVHYPLTPKLLSALYTEAMLLADEARSYFDRDSLTAELDLAVSVAFSCESLKVTTRLMHSIAWLLNQKAMNAGELSAQEANSESRDLGYAPASDEFQLARFPIEAQELILASEDLYFRLQRLNENLKRQRPEIPVPHQLVERIRQAF